MKPPDGIEGSRLQRLVFVFTVAVLPWILAALLLIVALLGQGAARDAEDAANAARAAARANAQTLAELERSIGLTDERIRAAVAQLITEARARTEQAIRRLLGEIHQHDTAMRRAHEQPPRPRHIVSPEPSVSPTPSVSASPSRCPLPLCPL